MALFSNKSNMKLDTSHPLLQELFRAVVKEDDCTIVEGQRGMTRQNQLFSQGKSKLKWPDSTHNSMPSMGVDAAPYIPGKGIPWEHPEQFYFFAGKVMAKARQLGIPVRWGGDWDRDGDVKDQRFNDLAHWELLGTEKKEV